MPVSEEQRVEHKEEGLEGEMTAVMLLFKVNTPDGAEHTLKIERDYTAKKEAYRTTISTVLKTRDVDGKYIIQQHELVDTVAEWTDAIDVGIRGIARLTED